ncbi:hypothetical protein [Spartinivicinus poritis]|uniref:Uncharacterized protein n=1 Tax=Spartinivicinus poritis TaxID=2994640 RepID=A0ABT5UM35_9GAMM|nr:hypothetical protein [Spartinivicinus sp. A2-2]MDE1466094.1 hypothetical protein [Spartinivicinus sp. A2-2]
MKNNERMIQFFDIGLAGKTHARDINHALVSPRTINEIMNELTAIKAENKARKKVSPRGTQEYRLQDICEHDDYWILLVNVVDTTAANPVTQKVGGAESDREIIELGDDKGLESSSHLIIYKEQNNAQKHLVLFEKNLSLPFKKAASFLNHLLKVAARHFADRYIRPHPSGIEGKTINLGSI